MRSERFRAAIAVGLAEYKPGELVEWTAGSLDQISREADEEDRLGLAIRRDVLP